MSALDQIVTIANQLVLTERDKDCMRQLIAQEVTLNYGRLCRFFSELRARRHHFAEVALYLRRARVLPIASRMASFTSVHAPGLAICYLARQMLVLRQGKYA